MSPGLRFASHLGYLSVEEPLFRASVGSIDAVAHIEFAARLGFHGVLYPWVATRPDEEVARVAAALDKHGMVAGCTAYAPLEVIPQPLWVQSGSGARSELLSHIRNHPQFGLVFDTGHVAAMDGAEKLTSLFKMSYDHVMALQLADLPGRVEVGGGVLEIGPVLLHAMLENFTGLVELEHQWSQAGAVGEAAGFERFRRIEAVAREEAMLSEPVMTKAMVRANGRTH